MTRSMSALLVLVSLAINSSFGADPAPRQAMAPHHVEASAAYVRIFAVVPLVGAGKTGDPIRPAYTPALASGANVDPNGILAYTVQIADDRQHALDEFVARTP